MRVLFVHTPVEGAPFNSSIAALSAWLRQHGHQTALLVVPPGTPPEAAAPLFARADAEVVAFSFMTCRAEAVRALIPEARRALPGARLVAGGAHPTSYPAETLARFDVDAVGVGVGEVPLLAWMEDPSRAHPGILRQGCNDPVVRWWAPDVDALPDWDRPLFGDVRNAGNRFEQAVGVALARGFCPFSCTFCGVDAYRRINQQPQRGASRLRSPERVVAEMVAARDQLPCPDGFAAWDEVMPTRRAWLEAFADLMRQRVGLPLAVQLRVEQVTPRFAADLARAGCDYAVLGVETGDAAYRAKVLNKPFSNEAAVTAFATLRDAGIKSYGSFMIGLPFETPRTLAATVRLARDLGATELSWKYYTPERGTALFPLLERHDLLIPAWVDHPFGGSEAMIRMTHCTQDHLDKAAAALELLRRGSARGTFEQRPERPMSLALRGV